jgi:hypothetical protein
MTLPDVVAHSSVAFAILGGLYLLARNKIKGQPIGLDEIFIGAAAGSAIPTGLILLYAAFVPNVIPTLRGLNVHIAAAGLALLFYAFRKLI